MTTSPTGFFARRWKGEVSISTLTVRDMMMVGTAINLATSFAALMALGFKASTLTAMLIYLSPLPYSVFLVASLWRAVERQAHGHAGALKIFGLCWLIVVTLI